MANVQHVSPSSFAVLPGGFGRGVMASSTETASVEDGSLIFPVDATKDFIAYHPSFLDILGESPTLEVIAASDDGRAFAHESGVWVEENSSVFFTSNLYRKPSPNNVLAMLRMDSVAKLDKRNPDLSSTWEEFAATPEVVTGNGATLFDNHLLVCSQGLGAEIPSSLSLVSPFPPYASKVILNNFYGRPFNSINDVVILPPPVSEGPDPTTDRVDLHSEPHTTIWFTDPTYAYAQSYKGPPQLPNQVYCFNPTTGDVRCVADGFGMPNGICFNYEGTKCYITDTAVVTGSGSGDWKIDPTKPGAIYVFDIVRPPRGADLSASGPTLHNRRMFAFVDSGVPDGIKTDTKGNVYSGCGDGVYVWNDSGTLIGKIQLGPSNAPSHAAQLADEKFQTRHCANFNFVPGGKIVVLAEDRIYLATLSKTVRGSLLP